MQNVARALVSELAVTPERADAIVAANARTLAMHVIPDDAAVFGYIGTDGSSDVMLVAGDRVICEIRIPA